MTVPPFWLFETTRERRLRETNEKLRKIITDGTSMNCSVNFSDDPGKDLKEFLKEVDEDMIFFFADSNTETLCLPTIAKSISIKPDHLCVVKAGEQYKGLDTVTKIWDMLMKGKARRGAVLVNVGGGVVCDLGGFAASTYKRGIRCVNIPTTLLAQVDAALGGKTGFDYGGLKNEIGTFSVPALVLIDNSFLKTLPEPQVISGYAEMLKHSLLADDGRLQPMMNVDLSKVADPSFVPILQQAVEVKMIYVIKDPLEANIRRALNLGHTVGHALESYALTHGVEWYHGYGVAYGLVAALYLSVKGLKFSKKLYEELKEFIFRIFPKFPLSPTPDEIYELMLHDKKNDGDGVNFTLLSSPGNFSIDCHCSKSEIFEALKELNIC